MILSRKAKLTGFPTTSFHLDNSRGFSRQCREKREVLFRTTNHPWPSLNCLLVSIQRWQCGRQPLGWEAYKQSLVTHWSCMLGCIFSTRKWWLVDRRWKTTWMSLLCFSLLASNSVQCHTFWRRWYMKISDLWNRGRSLRAYHMAFPAVRNASCMNIFFTLSVRREGLCREWNGFLQPAL